MSFDHAISKQAEIAARILNSFSNLKTLTTKTFLVEDFEKSFNNDEHIVLSFDDVKKYSDSQIEKSKYLPKEEANDLLLKSAEEIKSFTPIIVVGSNDSKNSFFVKKKVEKNS